MEISQLAASIEDDFLSYAVGLDGPPRTLDIVELEKQLHFGSSGKLNRRHPEGLSWWSRKHAREVRHMGRLPYMPGVFTDQKLNVPTRPINSLSIFLPETVYLKGFKKFYSLAVGSSELADKIVNGFNESPAFPESTQSITDWAIECLENDISFGLTTGHLERLSDVADLGAGLSLAVASQKGRKYINNFKLLINKNMTRETYKNIPLPWLISFGMQPYWGLPPGESLEQARIPDDVTKEVNRLVVDQYRRDRKMGAVALAFVMGGTRPKRIKEPGTGREVLELPECYTGSFITRSEGGVLVANRAGNDIEIGNVVPVVNGERKKTKNQLIDELSHQQAHQASRLLGLPVRYTALTGKYEGDTITVMAA